MHCVKHFLSTDVEIKAQRKYQFSNIFYVNQRLTFALSESLHIMRSYVTSDRRLELTGVPPVEKFSGLLLSTNWKYITTSETGIVWSQQIIQEIKSGILNHMKISYCANINCIKWKLFDQLTKYCKYILQKAWKSFFI